MNEKTLIWICLIFSLLGISLLFFLNKSTQPLELKISDLREGMDFVKIIGRVTRRYVSKRGTTFLTIQDGSGKIQAVIFKGINNRIYKGDRVEVIGNVQRYRGELEIIVKKIRRV